MTSNRLLVALFWLGMAGALLATFDRAMRLDCERMERCHDSR